MNLSAQIAGQGPALVILHGLFGSGTNWRTISRPWSEHYKVHLLDARNHGASPHDAEMNYAAMAADVSEYIDVQCPDGAHLLGHSMGGKTAMLTALSSPRQVKSLVVADVAPVRYAHDFKAEITALRAVPLGTIKSRSEADAVVAKHFDDPNLRAFLLQNLVRSSDGFRWRINIDALQGAISELTGFEMPNTEYDGPCTFVYGGASPYVRADHHEYIYRLFPNAELECLEGAGHWLHAEKPDAFSRAVVRHLKAHESGCSNT